MSPRVERLSSTKDRKREAHLKRTIWTIGLLSLSMNTMALTAPFVAQGVAAASAATPEKQDYVLFVDVRVKPESVTDFKQAILAIVSSTRAENGNLAYIVHQSPEDPTDFMVYEHWLTDEDHARHLHSSIFVNYSRAVAPMIANGYPIRKRMIVLN